MGTTFDIYVFIFIQDVYMFVYQYQGRIQDFKLGGGAHLKKWRRAEEGAKILGVFRVKKITILRQKILFFTIAEGGANIFGIFRVKNHDFTPTNHIFSNFRGGASRVRPPPWIRPCILINFQCRFINYFLR